MTIMQLLAAGARVQPGSQSFTSNGTFVVPAYNTLNVTVLGGKGADGGGYSGGLGGYASKTFAVGALTVGASITVTVGYTTVFGSSPAISAGQGGDAVGDTIIRGDNDSPDTTIPGGNGGPGSGSGGDVNVDGGSPSSGPIINITWS